MTKEEEILQKLRTYKEFCEEIAANEYDKALDRVANEVLLYGVDETIVSKMLTSMKRSELK